VKGKASAKSLTPALTGAEARRAQGTNKGQDNGEAMALLAGALNAL